MRFAEVKSDAVKKLAWVEFALGAFGPHWIAFIVWPVIGILWGLLHDAHQPFVMPAFGAASGLAVSLYFYFGDTRFSQAALAVLGLVAGGGLSILSGAENNAAIWSAVGFVVGLFGRYLIALILMVFNSA